MKELPFDGSTLENLIAGAAPEALQAHDKSAASAARKRISKPVPDSPAPAKGAAKPVADTPEAE